MTDSPKDCARLCCIGKLSPMRKAGRRGREEGVHSVIVPASRVTSAGD